MRQRQAWPERGSAALASLSAPKRHRLERADLVAIENLDQNDPARAVIAEILKVVRVSHWSFARFGSGTSANQLISSPNADNDGGREEFEHLREELLLQRERTAKGPKLAASLTPFREPYVSGITLVFADMRREFGVLNLLRTEELGPFTSAEMQALALALDSSADRLSGFTIAEDFPNVPVEDAANQSAMYVLDRDLRVVLTWDADQGRGAAITPVQTRLAQRLPPVIEEAVRKLVQTWTSDPATQGAGFMQPVPFLTVRAQPLSGPTGVFVGVLLQRPQGGQVFNKAAQTFKLSPREIETLAMLLQGATLNEVAQMMGITHSTVQDHIRSMLEKTGTRNRSELIAKLLRPGLAKHLRHGSTSSGRHADRGKS